MIIMVVLFAKQFNDCGDFCLVGKCMIFNFCMLEFVSFSNFAKIFSKEESIGYLCYIVCYLFTALEIWFGLPLFNSTVLKIFLIMT